MQINWTTLAMESYDLVVDQIFIDWGIEIVDRFENQVDELIHRIENHNHICPKSKMKGLHKCVINEHNSLIYRVKSKSLIEIILVIFNKSEHDF